MNGNNNNNKTFICNQNLPLKKRRTYFIDSNDENHSKTIKQSYNPPSPAVPTPPSSPHIELLRQQYAYLVANSTNNYFHPLMTQQFLENHQTVQQKRTDFTIDEHFRKSLGDNYHNRCLTPDDSSSNSSIIEQTTSVDSIEEHFARSLAKFRPLNIDDNHQLTESVVDDHFAKALGATTWEKLKEKS